MDSVSLSRGNWISTLNKINFAYKYLVFVVVNICLRRMKRSAYLSQIDYLMYHLKLLITKYDRVVLTP